MTTRTVAETGFRWWLGGGEHTGLSSAVTRHYSTSPHPSLYSVSFLRPRTGWNGRNWDCLSVARPDSWRTPRQTLTVLWEKPQGPEGTRAGKRCHWAGSKLLTYSSGTHSELPNPPKLQLVHSPICQKAKAAPTVSVFCP